MYTEYYNLDEKPFEMSPDPQFLWLGEKHKEALAALEYGIQENKGFLLLTGDVGTGKTVLINTLTGSTLVSVVSASIPDPDLEILDFFNYLSLEFQMNKTFGSKGAFLIEFKQFLHEVYRSEEKVLLIIDECQRLNHQLLEQIRVLSNIELNNKKLINIFFVGQTEFRQTLREDRNVAIRKRIAVDHHLDPLDRQETEEYINHRLYVAGAVEKLFTRKAAHEIFYFSGGNPRLINIICDHALLSGYSNELDQIDKRVILECKKDLEILIDTNPLPAEEDSLGQDQPVYESSGSKGKVWRIKKKWLYPSLIVASILIGFLVFYTFWENASNANPEKHSVFSENNVSQQDRLVSLNKTYQHAAPQNKAGTAVAERNTGNSAQTTAAHEKLKNRSVATAGRDKLNNQIGIPGNKQKYAETQRQTAQPATPGDKDWAQPAFQQDIYTIAQAKKTIQFGYDSMQLPRQAHEVLDQIVQFTTSHPGSEIIVEGHTDSVGDYRYNKFLSKSRAEVVKKYLVSRGIPETKIETVGRGSENPIASNNTLEGRKQNRRIEIRVKVK